MEEQEERALPKQLQKQISTTKRKNTTGKKGTMRKRKAQGVLVSRRSKRSWSERRGRRS